MTTNITEQARIQSVLSEQFHVFADDAGIRRVAIGGYILDYATFCTMLLWALAGSVAYMSLLAERSSAVDSLKTLNPADDILQHHTNYKATKYMYSKFGAVARKYTKEELAKIYVDNIDYT